MSVELVTGYSGVGSGGEPNRHVSSAEDGARQAGTVGLGCYVLSTGSKMSAIMEDANTLLVSDGDALINGRHVRIPDSLSFTIPTGVQGRRVSNLAVLRYEVGADSVESVTPLVLTGEPSTGTPTDPAYNEGSILDGDSPVDMPLYRVVTDGINAGDPEPLFDVLMSMSGLSAEIAEVRDSVSRIVTGTVTKSISQPSGTNWTYLTTILSYEEVEEILGRPFDVARDQFFATNVRWDACQALVVPFVQRSSRGVAVNVAITTPTGQSGGGQIKSLTIGWTIIKGE